MIYQRQLDLIERKQRAGITNRELANALNCSPCMVSSKLNGFAILSESERRIIESTISKALTEKESA